MKIESIQHLLSPLLRPFSLLYAGLLSLRRYYWERNKSRFRSSCPCIAVGNIAWGGTGKTPLTSWLLDWARAQQLTPVVLSRGYKASPPRLPLLVTPDLSSAQAGDEPLMLALEHPQAHILVDPKRSRAGRWAQQHLKSDLFILDDGFQHLPVHRDIDLVLLRQDDLTAGWGKVIPAGTWREGPSALTRATAFLLKANENDFRQLLPAIQHHILPLQKPLFSFTLKPLGLEPIKASPSPDLPASFPAGSPYVLLCGVGVPDQVARTAEELCGYPPFQTCIYPDHHAYSAHDAAQLAAHNLPILCTAKDAVKLRPFNIPQIWSIRAGLHFGSALGTPLPFPSWFAAQYAEVLRRKTR